MKKREPLKLEENKFLTVPVGEKLVECYDVEKVLADKACIRELRKEVMRLTAVLMDVRGEVEFKKGGPERDSCVSVRYLYRLVKEALGEAVEVQKWE